MALRLQTTSPSNLQFNVTVEITMVPEEIASSREQDQATGIGASYQKSPSRANTLPAVPSDECPVVERRQPDRRNSNLEGADRSSREGEYERLQQRCKELETDLETLRLQVQEGDRGRERWVQEMERLREDNLIKEVTAVIREMERLAEQGGTCAPSVTSSSTTDTSPSNSASSPEVEESGMYRSNSIPPLSPPVQQDRTGHHQHPSLSGPFNRGYAERSTCDPPFVLEMRHPTSNGSPPVNSLQLVASPRGGYVSGVSNPEIPNTAVEPTYAQAPSNHPAPRYGWSPYVYSEPQYPPFSSMDDVRSHRQRLYSYRDAKSHPQQSQPRSLVVRHFHGETHFLPNHPNQPPLSQFVHQVGGQFGGLGSSYPGTQPPSVTGDPFIGGFNPQLCQQHRFWQ